MLKIQLQVIRSLIGKIDYKFYTQEGDLLYIGSLDPLTTGVDSITKDVSVLPYSLSIESSCGEKFFSVHKRRGTFLRPLSFSIIHPGGRVVVTEGRRFEIPNLIIEYPGRDISIIGKVRDLTFRLKSKEDILADITAVRKEHGKTYTISIYDESIPKQVYMGTSIILDNLYQDY